MKRSTCFPTTYAIWLIATLAILNAVNTAAWSASWVVPISGEARRLQFELEGAAQENAWQDVYRIIVASTFPRDGGFVADAKDPLLFQPFPTAWKAWVTQRPQLLAVMRQQLSRGGGVRVERLLAQGNVAAIENLALQYYGTSAASDAHAWLGDRLMTTADFPGAVGHYREALPTATAAARPALAARLRLASAMLGQAVGQPPTQPVTIGQQRIEPKQFEQWVGEMLQRHRPGNIQPGNVLVENVRAAAGQGPPPAPGAFAARPWATYQGDVIGKPSGLLPPDWPDWPGRQVAAAVAGDLMLVGTRSAVFARELSSGKVRWAYDLSDFQIPGFAPLPPMRPLVVGNRLCVRIQPRTGLPDLVCLDMLSGKKLWENQSVLNDPARGGPLGGIVSDPLLVGNRLLVFALEAPAQTAPYLTVMELGPDSGKIISRKRLLEARDTVTWENCWVTSVGHRLVAVMGGAVFCLNPDCELLWFRQDPGTPLAIGLHHEQPALVVGDRLYLTDPVKGTIECIELESGVLHWRKTVPGLWRILQPAGDRLIVQTGDAILSLRGDTGQPVWRHVSHGMLDGFLQSGPDGLLLYAERDQQTPGDWCPALVWLDVKTGDVRAAGRLSGLHGSWVGAGPLVACDGRLWCFAAVQGPTAPTAYGPPLPERNICELVREGPAKPAGR